MTPSSPLSTPPPTPPSYTTKSDDEIDNDKYFPSSQQSSDNEEKVILDETPKELKMKQFIDLKDLHKFGLKIDEIDFADDSSDIDIIDEEASYEFLNAGGCDARSDMSVSLSSVVSQYSSMSAIREHFLEQIAKQEFAKQKRFWNDDDLDSSDLVS